MGYVFTELDMVNRDELVLVNEVLAHHSIFIRNSNVKHPFDDFAIFKDDKIIFETTKPIILIIQLQKIVNVDNIRFESVI